MVFLAYGTVWASCAFVAWKTNNPWIMILPLFVKLRKGGREDQ